MFVCRVGSADARHLPHPLGASAEERASTDTLYEHMVYNHNLKISREILTNIQASFPNFMWNLFCFDFVRGILGLSIFRSFLTSVFRFFALKNFDFSVLVSTAVSVSPFFDTWFSDFLLIKKQFFGFCYSPHRFESLFSPVFRFFMREILAGFSVLIGPSASLLC